MRPTTSILLTACFSVLLAVLFLAIQPAQAAPGTYIPVTVTQPDGSVLHLFASGDEYYNWLHDANGYTVMQDPDTGYYVYANLVEGGLVPTTLQPERDDPAAAGLVPQLNISAERREALRREFLAATPQGVTSAPTSGTITNLVVFIRFQDETQDIFSEPPSTYTGMLNTNASSLKNYYLEASYNTLTINSQFFPVPSGATILSYQDDHPRRYYQPYNTVTNPDGYHNYGSYLTDGAVREWTLLDRAVASINQADFPSGATLDVDHDGYVDDVTFIVSGSPTAWSSLLWGHRWSLYSLPDFTYINGKMVWDYNFVIETDTNVPVLVHETFHVLGAPDLYRYYNNTSFHPAGPWDIMDSVYRQYPPQHMSCYMKWKYGGWISSIPEVTAEGTYSLHPMGPSGECYKIASPNSSSEFYILEYRYDAGTFESTLPGSGLLVWRINSDYKGNADGPPDEVYVYRPGGTGPEINGTVNQAYYSSATARTAINDCTSPAPFLSDGSPGGLDVNSIGAAGTTISFHYAGPTGGTTYSISGNAGTSGAMLSYFDCGSKSVAAGLNGDYTLNVRLGWSGTVTPTKAEYAFSPASRTYYDVQADQINQDYSARIVPAPSISRAYPAAGSTVCRRPKIGVDLVLSERVRNAGGSFDASRVTLTLDGSPITYLAKITQSMTYPASSASMLYTPTSDLSLSPSPSHTVQFLYPSPSGTQTLTWHFTTASIACSASAAPVGNVELSSAQTTMSAEELVGTATPDLSPTPASAPAVEAPIAPTIGGTGMQNPYRRLRLPR